MSLLQSSDHLPLCFSFSIDNMHVLIPPADSTSRNSFSYNWYGASDANFSNYNPCTRTELAKIKLPFDALQCENVDCTSTLVYHSFRFRDLSCSVSCFKYQLDKYLSTIPDTPCIANYDNSLENSIFSY